MGDVVAFPVRQKIVSMDRREIVAMIHFHTAVASKVSGSFHKAMAEQLCMTLTEFDRSGQVRYSGNERR
jgi:hypothetical protein